MINIENWLRHQFANSDEQWLPGQKKQIKMPVDVILWVDNHFSESDRQEAMVTLARYADRDGRSWRLLRCVTYLSQGSLSKLDEYIQAANEDWRDVISWAEYDHGSGTAVQVRDMTKALAEE